jgi:hypothetical protein
VELAIAFSHVYRGELATACRALERTIDTLERIGLGGSWAAIATIALQLFLHFYLGNLRELRELATRTSAECLVRGNRLGLAHSAFRHSVFAWLALDDIDEAERRLTAAGRGTGERRYSLMHHLEAIAHVNLALYRGDVERGYRIIRRDITRALRSGVLLSQFVRIDAVACLARAAAAVANRPVVIAATAALRAERSRWANALAGLTLASLEDPAPAARRFRSVATTCNTLGMRLHADAARWHAARLDDSPAEQQAIEHRASAAGIARPDRMFRALVPCPDREHR